MNAVKKMFEGYEDSLEQFNAWRLLHADYDVDSNVRAQPVTQILLPWANHKAGLYQMFNNNLILSKHIEYKRGDEELVADMRQMLFDQRTFVDTFFNELATELHITNPPRGRYRYNGNTPEAQFYDSMQWILNESHLTEARLNRAISATIHGVKLQFAEGQKSMRVIGKVARVLGLEQEFEKFRVAHSVVLNQARLSGKLCLSIHPLDFATASDNEAGWSSCMSWSEEGSYRLGTVEMMTSPYVICAYLASDSTEMDIGNGTWPSKKWRAWVIVTEDFIVVNRNYPYENTDLSRACVDWVKELASAYYCTTYEETHDHWCQGAYIRVHMNYMYNDLGDNHVGCYATDVVNDDNEIIEINISGPATCMWCGNTIPYDSDDDAANTLCCRECSGRVQCNCCNEIISREYACWGPDGEPYCDTCYNERFLYCEHCDNLADVDDVYHIIIPVDEPWITKWQEYEEPDAPHTYVPRELGCLVCNDCLRDANIDPHTDLCWDTKMSFKHFTSWGSSTYWSNGATINPNVTTWNKIAPLFGYKTTDRLHEAIWNHYCECVSKSAFTELT